MSLPARSVAQMAGRARRELRLVPEAEEGSPYPKASLLLRGGARVVDLLVAVGLSRATGPAGVVVGLLYLLFADGVLQGQSIGKKIFGVRVIYLPTRAPGRHRDSVLRNAPLGLVVLLGMMPELGGSAFLAGALLVGGVEAWKVLRDPHGRRLGDDWAETQVIDGKVAAGQAAVRPPEVAQAPGRAMREGHGPAPARAPLASSLREEKSSAYRAHP